MAPRHKKRVSDAARPTFVIDNGGYTIKAGFASSEEPPQVIPNCIARSRDKRVYVGAQIAKCKDFGEMAFRRPVEKGFVVNRETQKAIWENSFLDKNAPMHCIPHDSNLIVTEAPNCPNALQTSCDQIIFEELEFAGYYRCTAPSLNAFNSTLESGALPLSAARPLLVVDSGYSHTTITPIVEGRPAHGAIRRVDIGGKFMTNYLNELVSLRHYDLRDEPYLLNEIKEDVSFVSDDFSRDLEQVWQAGKARPKKKPRPSPDAMDLDEDDKSILIDYVLPDYEKLHRGFLRPHDPSQAAKARRLAAAAGEKEHVIPLGNERFVVPELLFNPRDVGMAEAGLPEVIMQSVSALPESLIGPMLANVVLVGGNALIRGLKERLQRELRQIVSDHIPVRVFVLKDPITATWSGGARLANNPQLLKKVIITKQQYDEHGSTWLARQFAKSSPV